MHTLRAWGYMRGEVVEVVGWYTVSCTNTHTHIQWNNILLYALFQCDQQSPRAEAGGGDSDVVTEAHRQHCGHLLRLLHYLWHTGSAGEEREGTHRNNEKTKIKAERLQILQVTRNHQLETDKANLIFLRGSPQSINMYMFVLSLPIFIYSHLSSWFCSF